MRAVRLLGARRLHVAEIDTADLGPHDLLVRVEACGIDGTDRHIVRGEYPSALPVTLGHEFAGTVVAVGDSARLERGTRGPKERGTRGPKERGTRGPKERGTRGPKERGTRGPKERGTRGPKERSVRVAVDPNIACGACRECRRGDVCLCPHRLALGVDLDGGLAEFARVPAAQAYPLPPEMPIEWGALAEPIACCLHGLDLVPIRSGVSVAIIGGGVIGLLMVQLCRLAGAARIVLITRQASRRALAERLGAALTCDPHTAGPPANLTDHNGAMPGGADVVLECAGTVETFEQAIGLARRGGSVLVFGVAPQGAVARINPYDIFARELHIVGSYLNPLTHGRAIELAASGRLELDALITTRLSLDEVPSALNAAPAPGEVKAIVYPS